MPITKERVERILTAADAIIEQMLRMQNLCKRFAAGSDGTAGMVEHEVRQRGNELGVTRATNPAAVELYEIAINLHNTLLDELMAIRFDVAHIMAIASEKAKFQTSWKHNTRMKQNMRLKRQQQAASTTTAKPVPNAELEEYLAELARAAPDAPSIAPSTASDPTYDAEIAEREAARKARDEADRLAIAKAGSVL